MKLTPLRVAGLATILTLVALSVVAISMFAIRSKTPSPSPTTPADQQSMVVEGELICLPHRKTDGPQTMECAAGIKTTGGTMYGLGDHTSDHRLLSRPFGKKIRVTGTFTRKDDAVYTTTGTIAVEKVEDL